MEGWMDGRTDAFTISLSLKHSHKDISKCYLLKILSRVLSIKQNFSCILGSCWKRWQWKSPSLYNELRYTHCIAPDKAFFQPKCADIFLLSPWKHMLRMHSIHVCCHGNIRKVSIRIIMPYASYLELRVLFTYALTFTTIWKYSADENLS